MKNLLVACLALFASAPALATVVGPNIYTYGAPATYPIEAAVVIDTSFAGIGGQPLSLVPNAAGTVFGTRNVGNTADGMTVADTGLTSITSTGASGLTVTASTAGGAVAGSFQRSGAAGNALIVGDGTALTNWTVSAAGAVVTTSGSHSSSNATTGFIYDGTGNLADLFWVRGGNPTPTDNYFQIQPTAQTTPFLSVGQAGVTNIIVSGAQALTVTRNTSIGNIASFADGTQAGNGVLIASASSNRIQFYGGTDLSNFLMGSGSIVIIPGNTAGRFAITSSATTATLGGESNSAGIVHTTGSTVSNAGWLFRATAVPTVFMRLTHGNAAVAAQFGFNAAASTTPNAVQLDVFGSTNGLIVNNAGASSIVLDTRNANLGLLSQANTGRVTNNVSGVAVNGTTTPQAVVGLYVLGSNTTGTTPIANSTTPTAFSGTGWSQTLQATSLIAGRTIHVYGGGIYSTTLTPTLTLDLMYGSTVLVTSGAVTTPSGATNQFWSFDAYVTCLTTGASGTAAAHGNYCINGLTTDCAAMGNTSGSVTFDTTAASALTIRATWGTASASNTITGHLIQETWGN